MGEKWGGMERRRGEWEGREERGEKGGRKWRGRDGEREEHDEGKRVEMS